jgi:hypothetical protein
MVDVQPDGPLTVCAGDGLELTATLAGGAGPFAFGWMRDGVDIPGADTATYTPVDSGTHEYSCRVQGDGCPDWVVDPWATELTWRAEPFFGGLESATDAASTICSVDLGWQPATPVCAGPVTYSIYRSETSGFTPGPSNLVEEGFGAVTYRDSVVLSAGIEYFYVVRSVDASNGADDGNLVELSAVPLGPGGGSCVTTSPPVFIDDFEAGNLSAWTVVKP